MRGKIESARWSRTGIPTFLLEEGGNGAVGKEGKSYRDRGEVSCFECPLSCPEI